jgi:hypothetical protein
MMCWSSSDRPPDDVSLHVLLGMAGVHPWCWVGAPIDRRIDRQATRWARRSFRATGQKRRVSCFTAHVDTGTPLSADHPNRPHHRRLVGIASRLGRKRELAWCQGCTWWCVRPTRLGDAAAVAHQHIATAHFSALIAGRACLDPDLSDGGAAYLAERFGCVHPPIEVRHG